MACVYFHFLFFVQKVINQDDRIVLLMAHFDVLPCRIVQSLHGSYYGCALPQYNLNRKPPTNKALLFHYFLISADPSSQTPCAAVLHLHLIRPVHPLWCLCCCLYGPFILCLICCLESSCSRATWIFEVKGRMWFIIPVLLVRLGPVCARTWLLHRVG